MPSLAPHPGACLVLAENLRSIEQGQRFTLPRAFLRGIIESRSDSTTSPPLDENGNECIEWIDQYEAGREIARAALGLDIEGWD